MSDITVLGFPTSAASYSAGQELAPQALRAAGLVEALRAAGHRVDDAGDLTLQAWRPDRENPRAQNLDQVVSSLRELGDAVRDLAARDHRLLVLGGNCTAALGVLAGLRAAGRDEDLGLLYLDRHLDLNTPATTAEGALDWMGVAHALAVDGSVPEVLDVLGERPLLAPDRVSYLGVQETETTDAERATVAALGIPVVPQADLVADPQVAARRALDPLGDAPFVIHLDVDVLDFTDAPLAENANTRGSGPTLEQVGTSLAVAWARPGARALSVGELNPVHAQADPGLLERVVAVLTRALTRD